MGLDTRASLEVVTTILHGDIYDVAKQGEVSRLKMIVEELETRKARGVSINMLATHLWLEAINNILMN